MERLEAAWNQVRTEHSKSFVCGYCGKDVAPDACFTSDKPWARIRICSGCNRPTFFEDDEQIPGPVIGGVVEHVPAGVAEVYEEARKSMKVGAYTGAALLLRKVLMNVAVANGAPGNQSFKTYVEYLRDNHYLPPGGETWVGHIRKKGNEATHELPEIDKDDATELLAFAELLLKFVYEFPGRLSSATEKSPGDS